MTMTIDSAIQHCEEVAKEQESHGYCDRSLCVIMDVNNATCDECEAVKCRECASEHRQLAEWLKELKAYRENTCDDAISRQAAIDAITKTSGIRGDALKALYDLPSVTPQQRTGEWIEHFDEIGKWYECDQCHTDWGGPVNYCPSCGCAMKGELE